jgi:hypothetical protein
MRREKKRKSLIIEQSHDTNRQDLNRRYVLKAARSEE